MPTAALLLGGGLTPRGAGSDSVEPFNFGLAVADSVEPWNFGEGMVGNSSVEPFDFGFLAYADSVEPFNFGANVRADSIEPFDFGSSGGSRGGGGYLGPAPASPVMGYRDR